jgi:hypothetical protein
MIAPRPRAAVAPQPVALEKMLLVEGETPAHFFEGFAKHLGLADLIEIRSYGGIAELGTFLKTLASTTEFRAMVKSLGIVRDAETDANGARQSVNAAVAGANLPGHITPSIFILPNNSSKGMIETLCLRSVESTPLYQCVKDFIKCAEGAGATLSDADDPDRDKARLQVYLAATVKPQMMPGLAAYRGVYRFDDTTFEALRQFLRSL